MMITGVSINLGSCPRRRIPRRRKTPPLNYFIIHHLPICRHRHRSLRPSSPSHSTHLLLSLLLTGRLSPQRSRRRRTQHPIQTRPQRALSLLRTTHHRFFYQANSSLSTRVTLYRRSLRIMWLRVLHYLSTDPPSLSGYRFSWSLGDPFLKR